MKFNIGRFKDATVVACQYIALVVSLIYTLSLPHTFFSFLKRHIQSPFIVELVFLYTMAFMHLNLTRRKLMKINIKFNHKLCLIILGVMSLCTLFAFAFAAFIGFCGQRFGEVGATIALGTMTILFIAVLCIEKNPDGDQDAA